MIDMPVGVLVASQMTRYAGVQSARPLGTTGIDVPASRKLQSGEARGIQNDWLRQANE